MFILEKYGSSRETCFSGASYTPNIDLDMMANIAFGIQRLNDDLVLLVDVKYLPAPIYCLQKRIRSLLIVAPFAAFRKNRKRNLNAIITS